MQEETARYINHRLKRAAIAAPLEFPRDATDLIHARSGGVPRMINVICDAVLLFGYADDSRVIHPALVHEAIAELESSNVLRRAVALPQAVATAETSVRPPNPTASVAAPARTLAPPNPPLRPAASAADGVFERRWNASTVLGSRSDKGRELARGRYAVRARLSARARRGDRTCARQSAAASRARRQQSSHGTGRGLELAEGDLLRAGDGTPVMPIKRPLAIGCFG